MPLDLAAKIDDYLNQHHIIKGFSSGNLDDATYKVNDIDALRAILPKKATTQEKQKSDTPSNATLPELENSYAGIKKDEKNAMAERNKKALASFPDEQTMRDSLRKLHVPILRAMSGLTGSGLKKDDFINAIVDENTRIKNRPLPDGSKQDQLIPIGAVLKEGSFTAKGNIHKEATYKVKPVKRQWLSGNKTVDALEITSPLEPSFYYYPEHDLFAVDSLSEQSKNLEHDVEKAFREHLHEFYDLSEYDTTQVQPVQQTKPAKPETQIRQTPRSTRNKK